MGMLHMGGQAAQHPTSQINVQAMIQQRLNAETTQNSVSDEGFRNSWLKVPKSLVTKIKCKDFLEKRND